jgi:hypothetical protein
MGFMDFLSGVRRTGSRILGQIGSTLKRVGETALPALKTVGNFVVNHHQPISALLQGASDLMPNNTLLRNVAGASMLGSAVLTSRGVGKDYFNRRPPPTQ